jgi:hypothetical protein
MLDPARSGSAQKPLRGVGRSSAAGHTEQKAFASLAPTSVDSATPAAAMIPAKIEVFMSNPSWTMDDCLKGIGGNTLRFPLRQQHSAARSREAAGARHRRKPENAPFRLRAIERSRGVRLC